MFDTDLSIFRCAAVPLGTVSQPRSAQTFEWTSSRAALYGFVRKLGQLFLIIVALYAPTTTALADEKKMTVQAGDTQSIATSNNPIVNNSGQLKGAVSIKESDATPKTYTLNYLAPEDISNFTETVKYSDGTDHTVQVSVTPSTKLQPVISIYPEAFKALFVLFIIATILESGLAVIFNWRPFVQLFDARGVKTIVSVLFAYIFVTEFNLDIVARLVSIYSKGDYPSGVPVGLPGTFITALVLAGGSSGVNNLLVALGFRSVKTAEQTTPKPPPSEAWVSVRLIRKAAKGRVAVLIGPTGATQVVGTINASWHRIPLLSFFLRDYGRFPTAGGFALAPGAIAYEVVLKGDVGAAPRESKKWGPYPLAPGAIVDIDLEL